MLRKITCAVSFCALSSLPLAARADDSARLLSEQHFTTIRSFKIDMVYRSPRGMSDKQITYVAPDRLRMDFPAQKMSAVTIGREIWLLDPDNKWHKEDAPPGKDPMAIVHSLTRISESIKSKTVTYVGPESLDGVATHVYTLQAPPKRGFSAISEKLWLGLDGYPRKIIETNGPYSMHATYSAFNAPLHVGL